MCVGLCGVDRVIGYDSESLHARCNFLVVGHELPTTVDAVRDRTAVTGRAYSCAQLLESRSRLRADREAVLTKQLQKALAAKSVSVVHRRFSRHAEVHRHRLGQVGSVLREEFEPPEAVALDREIECRKPVIVCGVEVDSPRHKEFKAGGVSLAPCSAVSPSTEQRHMSMTAVEP